MSEIEKGLDQCESELDTSMNVFNVSTLLLIDPDIALHRATRSTQISSSSKLRSKHKESCGPIVLLQTICYCKSSPTRRICDVSYNTKLLANTSQSESWRPDNV
jgi:hypothetical protein